MEPLTWFVVTAVVDVDASPASGVADACARRSDGSVSGDDARDRRPSSARGDDTVDSDSLSECSDADVSREAISHDFSTLDSLSEHCNKFRSNGQNGADGQPNDNRSFHCASTWHSSLAGTRRVRCGLLACSGRGLLAMSTLMSACCACLAAVLLFAGLTQELESKPLVSLQRVGLSVW